MMPITTLPARTANSIGATKTDKRPPTGASHEWKAAEINETLDRLIEIFAEIGLSDGTTANSLNAQRKVTAHVASGTLVPGLNSIDVDGVRAMVLPAATAGVATVVDIAIGYSGAGSVTIEADSGVATSIVFEAGIVLGVISTSAATLPGSDRDSVMASPGRWRLTGTVFSGIEVWYLETAQTSQLVTDLVRGYSRADVAAVSSSPYALATERVLLVDTSGGAIEVDIPDAATTPIGRSVLVVKTTDDANAITLDVGGVGSVVRGATDSGDPYTLPGSNTASRGSWEVVCDGTDWILRAGGGGGESTTLFEWNGINASQLSAPTNIGTPVSPAATFVAQATRAGDVLRLKLGNGTGAGEGAGWYFADLVPWQSMRIRFAVAVDAANPIQVAEDLIVGLTVGGDAVTGSGIGFGLQIDNTGAGSLVIAGSSAIGVTDWSLTPIAVPGSNFWIVDVEFNARLTDAATYPPNGAQVLGGVVRVASSGSVAGIQEAIAVASTDWTTIGADDSDRIGLYAVTTTGVTADTAALVSIVHIERNTRGVP